MIFDFIGSIDRKELFKHPSVTGTTASLINIPLVHKLENTLQQLITMPLSNKLCLLIPRKKLMYFDNLLNG